MLKYIGNGTQWVTPVGIVPPRNLTDAEVKKYGGKAALLKSGLYQEVKGNGNKRKD